MIVAYIHIYITPLLRTPTEVWIFWPLAVLWGLDVALLHHLEASAAYKFKL